MCASIHLDVASVWRSARQQAKPRDVKQRIFNEMVEGNGRQSAEVVDSVVYALTDSALPNTPVLYHSVS